MSETLEPVTDTDGVDQQQLAEQLLTQAKEQGVDLVDPNGLLNRLTKNVLETALEAEMTEHVGYDKHDPSAKGLTTGEIAAHFDDVYGARVSKDTISRITDKVVAEMTEWANRPLDPVYPVIFVDAIHVKIRDGQVTNRPIYVAIGVTHPR